MASDLTLRRKLTLRAHGKQVVFIKRQQEGAEHVWMKAFLWALYLPPYPDLQVEVGIGERYKPDVVQLGADGQPVFWGEAGKVGLDKIRWLAKRFPHTHLALAKWSTPLRPHAAVLTDALTGLRRTAPFDLLCFDREAPDRFVDAGGHVRLSHDDVEWVRFEG